PLKPQLQDREALLLEVDQLGCRIHLLAQRCRLYGRDRDVGTQCRPGRDHLEASGLFLRLQRLEGAAVEPEDIGLVGDRELRGEQAVLELARDRREVGYRREHFLLLLTAPEHGRRNGGKERPALRQHIFVGDPQRRLRRRQVVVVLQ